MGSGEYSFVAIIEHLLSFVVCSVCSIVLWANMRTLKWKVTVSAETYFKLILSCLVVFAMYNAVLIIFLWYEDLSYVPTTATTVVEQTFSCSILAAVRVAFVSCTDWLAVLIVFETFKTICWGSAKRFYRIRILEDTIRPGTYATVTFLGTLAQMFTIGLVVGFGRNDKGCSFKVTRPGGKPTASELMTYYGYNFTLLGLIVLMQSYSAYFVCSRLGLQGSGTARRKKKAVACKMMILPIGLLVLWSFKSLRRIFPYWSAIAMIKLHIDRLEGFLTATLLLCLNNRFREACWTLVASNKVGKSISRFCSGKEEPPYFPINAAETSETFRLRESTNEGGKGLLSFHPSFFAEVPEDENDSENHEDENKSNTGELRMRTSSASDEDESFVVYSPPELSEETRVDN